MSATVIALSISATKGIKKTNVESVLLREGFGLEGDAHGGPWHRQVSLLAEESIDIIRARGLPHVHSGDFAENITTRGITLHTLAVGTRLRVGEALLEITQIGKECHQRCAIFHSVGDCVMPREGVFAKVIQGAVVKTGCLVRVEIETATI